ncbi:MAG: hypothetical protein AB7N91_16545 [Candidatus Tectimicrobiota bacterium]
MTASTFHLKAPEPNARRGGVLRYGTLSAPAHFDVHQSGTVANMGTQGAMYDNLIRRDPRDSGQAIIPDLAHSWEFARDPRTTSASMLPCGSTPSGLISKLPGPWALDARSRSR